MQFSALFLGVFALASPALAQGVNVALFSDTVGPSQSFGAAANQPGVWNRVVATTSAQIPLVDLAGAPTTITVTKLDTANTVFAVQIDNPATTGDDELLMDYLADPEPTGTWIVEGLRSGAYSVYSYAWAPDSSTYISGVTVNGGTESNVGGAWPGGYILGTTHALDFVFVPAGGAIMITVRGVSGCPCGSFNGFQLKPNVTPSSGYCFGDGTDAACPCGNPGGLGRGCNNTAGMGGARLNVSGFASIAHDSLSVSVTGAIPFGPCLFYEGSARANTLAPFGIAFGNGLRCAGGTTNRLGIRFADASGAASTAGVLSALGGAVANTTYHYQAWYRDSPNFGACTAGFNLSSGVSLAWVP